MSFYQFLVRIFSFFHTIVTNALQPVFNLLINNNIIKFTLCVGVLIFIIEYHFEIIHLLPRILGFTNEQEKEFETRNYSQVASGINKDTGIRETYSVTKTKRKRVK